MNTLILIQENIQPLVKLFPQLGDGRNGKDENHSSSLFQTSPHQCQLYPSPSTRASIPDKAQPEDAVNASLYLLNSFLGASNTEDANSLEPWGTERLVLCIPTAPCHPGCSWEHLSTVVGLLLHGFPLSRQLGKGKAVEP